MFRILLSFWLKRSVLAAWGCLAIAGATLPVTGGSIVWEAPQPISDIEEDVSTNGVMAYAYFCYFNYWTTLYPRGQRFTTWHTNRYTDKPRFDNDVEMLTGWYGRNAMGEALTNFLSGTVSYHNTYRSLLSCSADSQYRGQPITLRLKNLQPGSRYEVQLWSNANNKTNDCDAPMLLDDGETLLATYTPLPGGTNGPGEHVKGTFTATNTFYDLRLTPETNKLAVLNMFQVRLLSPVAPVTWEPPADITDENDIRTDGKPVFAWGFTGTNYTLKGTTFNSQTSHLMFFPRGNFSVAQNDAPYFTDFMVSPTNGSIARHSAYFESAQTSSSDYFRMLSGGLYRDKESVALVFGNLIQGHTYLIQLWVGDGREKAPTSGWSYRTVSIDGSAPLQYGGGPN